MRTRPASASIATTTACEPSRSASSVTSAGRASAAELTETLSAPAASSCVGVGDAADAAADRERDRELLGDAADELDERVALLERRLDVEEDELVGARVGVGGAELDRVADVAQALEADALDDAAAGDVEARDQARERDRSLPRARRRGSARRRRRSSPGGTARRGTSRDRASATMPSDHAVARGVSAA